MPLFWPWTSIDNYVWSFAWFNSDTTAYLFMCFLHAYCTNESLSTRHDKLCAYPNPLKLLMFFLFQYNCNWVYGIDVGAFFTDYSMDKKDWIFQLLALRSHNNLPKDMPKIKRMSKFFGLTKMRQSQIINIIHFVSITLTKLINFHCHTESEFSVSWRYTHS